MKTPINLSNNFVKEYLNSLVGQRVRVEDALYSFEGLDDPMEFYDLKNVFAVVQDWECVNDHMVLIHFKDFDYSQLKEEIMFWDDGRKVRFEDCSFSNTKVEKPEFWSVLDIGV